MSSLCFLSFSSYLLSIRKVPFYGFLDTFFKLQGRFPTEFIFQFSSINSVTEVVTSTVGYESDEFFESTFEAT